MALLTYYTNNDGNVVEAVDRLPADTFEVTIHAEEASVGNSQIEIRDPDGDFNVRGHRLVYFIEADAATDDWLGVIGPFYTNRRQVRRGDGDRVTDARTWTISLDDVNTLLSRRVQKGTDAEREEETDVERLTWLVDTAEVIGGVGDSGFAIEDTDLFFTDTPVPMSESNYRGVDSAQVINDLLQQSGKNCYLYNSPTVGNPIRIGIWYGRTERTDFASIHKISNVLSDVDIETTYYFIDETIDLATPYVFAPSRDAELDRDPSRVYSGAYVNYDAKSGTGYAYAFRPETADDFAARDGVFQAELVKTQAAADARARRYTRDLRSEDDAITCAVIVPAKLVHAWYPGHRVQVKFSHLPGYESFTWMRVAAVTYRQISADMGLYELGLDLRGEVPPESGTGSGGSTTAYGVLHQSSSGEFTGGILHWGHSGDEADILTYGYASEPNAAEVEDIVDPSPPLDPWPYLGKKITGTGTIDVYLYATVNGVVLAGGSHTITWSILKNGVAVATQSKVVSSASNIALVNVPGFVVPTVEVAGVSVAPDDEITASVTCTPGMYAFRSPAGANKQGEQLRITGGTLS